VLKLTDLIKIFGSKTEVLTGVWRRMSDVNFYLSFSVNINEIILSNIMGCVRHVSHMVDRSDAQRDLVGKPEGKK
jgi:hypothetical protein